MAPIVALARLDTVSSGADGQWGRSAQDVEHRVQDGGSDGLDR